MPAVCKEEPELLLQGWHCRVPTTLQQSEALFLSFFFPAYILGQLRVGTL